VSATEERVCPRCRRAAGDGARCPHDGAYYVSRRALEAAGRDAYLGALIADRYAVLERIGVGGMGTVYRARDERTGERVAIKFLRDEYAGHRSIRRRFVREAEAGASLDHPNIVRLTDFGIDADRTLYIVMEFVGGWTLREEVNRNGPFSIEQVTRLSRQLLLGLAAAHDAGLVHRDLKHDNIMFHGDREEFSARILDFGVVKITAGDSAESGGELTANGAMVGSPSYMSPEQLRGLRVGPPADLYALAVVLYEALTSRRLFPASNYDALLRAGARRDAPPLERTGRGEPVPPALDRWLRRALAHDPADRYPSARTMLLALEQIEADARSEPGDLFADAPGTAPPLSIEADEPEEAVAEAPPPPEPVAAPPTPVPVMIEAVPEPPPRRRPAWQPAGAFATAAVAAFFIVRLLG
jgi:serine/threonine-protein kinase